MREADLGQTSTCVPGYTEKSRRADKVFRLLAHTLYADRPAPAKFVP